jgi:hypothetical protein
MMAPAACERLHKECSEVHGAARRVVARIAGPGREGDLDRVKLPIPKAVRRRVQPLVERGQVLLREWEWTWTTAFLAGVAIAFAAITTMAVIPSWFLYFAEQTLGWTKENRILLTLRDVLVTGYLTVVVGAFVVTAFKIQTIRRRLRGEKQAERYSGGYR